MLWVQVLVLLGVTLRLQDLHAAHLFTAVYRIQMDLSALAAERFWIESDPAAQLSSSRLQDRFQKILVSGSDLEWFQDPVLHLL